MAAMLVYMNNKICLLFDFLLFFYTNMAAVQTTINKNTVNLPGFINPTDNAAVTDLGFCEGTKRSLLESEFQPNICKMY